MFTRLVCLLAVCLVAVSPLSAIMTRHDRADADYVRLGTKYPAVAWVQAFAEGALIAPRWVLTAAHVASELAPAGSFVELAGRRYAVDAIVIHPSEDIALLRLAEAVDGVAPIAPYTGTNEMGMTVTFVGRGDTGDGNSGPVRADAALRGATNVVDRVDASVIGFTFDAPPKGTRLEGISGPGDSGGPAIIERNGRMYTIGVSSANASEGAPCRYGSREIYTRVSAHREWIAKAMGDSSASLGIWTAPLGAWTAPVWGDALPKSPLGEHAQAFLEAVRVDAASMRAFRLEHRPERFLASRPEEKFVKQEAIWRSLLHDAGLEGYATNAGRLALFLSRPNGTWYCVVLHGDAKVEGILDSEILRPTSSESPR